MDTVLKQMFGLLAAKWKTQMRYKSSMTCSVLQRLGGCKLVTYDIKNHMDLSPYIYHYALLVNTDLGLLPTITYLFVSQPEIHGFVLLICVQFV
jgi:hypothetical protein